MSKLFMAAMILTAAIVAAQANGSQLASAQSAAASAGFASSEIPAARVAAPKSAPAAGQPSVVITSFNLTGNNSHVAEICGQVTGASADVSVVRVSVDPSEKAPGIYNVLAGGDGVFCAVVVTYTGQAEASVKGMNKPFSASAAAGQSGR